MKITIIIGTMINGGAHRVATMQANELAKRGYDVTLLLVVGGLCFPYEIDRNVKIVNALPAENLEFSDFKSKVRRKLIAPFKLIKKLKLVKPDLVISHIQSTNREAIISCKALSIPVIVCEHTSVNMPYGFAGKIAYLERRFLYKLAILVTVLTYRDVEKFYSKYLNNVRVIPNPSPFEPNKGLPQKNRQKNIVAVGDLNRIEVKGWDNLIEVFSHVSSEYPEWKLQFAGAGEHGKSFLQKQAQHKGISKKVEFLGSIRDVKALFQNSSIFILTSRNEGLPMALIEAMSQGCACIAFDCETGPSDIIKDNVNGFLVENQNIDNMIIRLKELMKNEEKRVIFSKKAIISSKRFSQKKIFDQWVEVIEKSV